MHRLFFIRHGETEWNYLKKIQGKLDIELNNTGEIAAFNLSNHLKHLSINGIYSSDLARAIRTAKIIKETYGKDIEIISDSRLRERDFGDWEGLTLSDIESMFPEKFLEWRSQPKTYRVENGESMTEVIVRVRNSIEGILSKDFGNYIIVTHGGVIKPLIMDLFEISLNQYNNVSISNTSVTIIDFQKGKFHLKVLNWTPLENLL